MAPPALHIDLKSPTPAYRQIVDQLRHLLVTEALPPGATLPSVRRLATDLGIHHNTVAEAYRTLAFEGWLEVVQGKPVRVAHRAETQLDAASQKNVTVAYEERLRLIAAEMRAQGLTATAIAKLLRGLAAKFATEFKS